MTGTRADEAKRVIDGARERGVHLRVIGGLAVKIRCPSAQHRALARAYGDVDLVGYRSQRAEIGRALVELGYEPNERFNALQGHRRLLFVHPDGTYDVDVFLDVFPMCHELNFVGRLEKDTYTVPLPDLALSKLQVIQLNEKDVKDLYALIEDHDVGRGDDPELVDLGYITQLCGNDWGWYKTVSMNIDKIILLADEYLAEDDAKDVIVARLQRLREEIEAAPKSLKWKIRARVGERVRWYELPEDMEGETQEAGAHRGTGKVG
jgi:hypothetical protein